MRVMKSVMVAAVVVGSAVGCVEDSGEEPNSDQGYLFVDLEHRLAVDWEAEVLVRGPSAGGEFCDEVRGCYPDHETLQMEEVRSSDPEVVEVTDFEPDSYGEADAVRVDLDVVGEGEATLEFEFAVPGMDTEQDEEASQQGEQSGDDELITDSFRVYTGEVVGLRLHRDLDGVDSMGPHAHCPETSAGVYLMDSLDDYTVPLKLLKYDAQGNPLRGSGKFPVDIEPEDAVELEDVDEPRRTVEIRPTAFGSVTMTPEEGGGDPVEAHFTSMGDISQMDVRAYQLSGEGQRMGEAEVMIAEQMYEIEAMPRLASNAPLCGGAVETSLQSTTPAICEQVGVMETTGNPAVYPGHGGQCSLEVEMDRGSNAAALVESHSFSVEYDW